MIKTEQDAKECPTEKTAQLAKVLAGLVLKGRDQATDEVVTRLQESMQISEGLCCESIGI